MAGAAKLGAAAGVAALGIGAAVYSAWSLQRRPTSAPPRAGMVGGGGGATRSAPGDNGIQVRFSPETAQQLGMTPEELDAKVKDLLAKGVPPQDLGKELGLGDASLRVEQRAQGGSGERRQVDPAPVGPFDFVRADSAVSTAKLEGLMEAGVEEVGRDADGLEVGRGDPRDVARAARLALVGPVAGKAAFAEAVRELRGRVADDGGLTGSAVGLAEILEGAQLDPTKVRVKGIDVEEEMPRLQPRLPEGPEGTGGAGGAGMRMMMRIARQQSADGPAQELATMTIPVSDVWPDTADEVEDGEIAVEARVPARLKDLDVEDGRAEIGVVMVRERGSRVWQPVKYNLYVWDGKAAQGFARGIQARRK